MNYLSLFTIVLLTLLPICFSLEHTGGNNASTKRRLMMGGKKDATASPSVATTTDGGKKEVGGKKTKGPTSGKKTKQPGGKKGGKKMVPVEPENPIEPEPEPENPIYRDKCYTASQIFAFGDSLTDVGNKLSLEACMLPEARCEARTANGLLAIDYFAEGVASDGVKVLHSLAGGNNYAWSAARANPSEIGLQSQIQQFLAAYGDDVPSDALYFIWMGGNDVQAALVAPDPEAVITIAMEEFQAGILSLLNAGIPPENLIILNVPDLGLIPRINQLPPISSAASSLSVAFNAALAALVEGISQTYGTEIFLHDAYTIVSDIVASGEFSNVVDACVHRYLGPCGTVCPFEEEPWPPLPDNTATCWCPLPVHFIVNEDCVLPEADGFAFYDGLHPVSAAHKIIADSLTEAYCV